MRDLNAAGPHGYSSHTLGGIFKNSSSARPPLPTTRLRWLANCVLKASSPAELAAYADRYLDLVKSGVVTVVAGDMFVIKVSKDLTSEYDAARLAALLGTGGGQKHLARGKLNGSANEAFKRLEEALQ